jgi:hypothetical protein
VRYAATDLVAQMNSLRTSTGKPVTTTETFLNYQTHPDIVAAGDWVFPNLQPWFNGALDPSDIGGMVQAVVGEVAALQTLAGNQVVVVKESWWPTAGPAGASESNQVEYFRQLAEQPVFFVWGEAYDQPWKSEDSPSGSLGPNWGLHTADRTPKAIIAELRDIYTQAYFPTRDLLPGALAFLRQMTLANGLPQNEATASELALLSDTVNSIPANNRFFNPAQAGFWLTTSVLSHALGRQDAAFAAGMSDSDLVTELTATIQSLEAISNTANSVYRSPPGETPAGIAFFQNYDSITGQPRAGAVDRQVPFIDNGYLAVGLLATGRYLRRAASQGDVGPRAEFLDLANRAEALAKRIQFAFWFDAESKRFHLGGTNDPMAGGVVDRLTSESRLVPVLAFALGQISRSDFDAAMRLLVRESRSGSRIIGSPGLERLPVFGTALELFVPTIFLSSERETMFGQSTLAQAVFAAVDTAQSLGLPAAGAMGIANGGTPPDGADAKYLNFGLSPAELAGDANNPRDQHVLVPPAAAIMAGTMSKLPNPHLQAAGEAAARNASEAIDQLRAAGQFDATYGAPNYLDFGSQMVNSVNPVRGFLEIAQLAAALLNNELGGDYLESLLRYDIGWRTALDAYRQALNVRELEFSANGAGTPIIRSNASGGSNLTAPAETDGGVWHLQSVGDSATYDVGIGLPGIYRAQVRYSNHDGGSLDDLQIALNGQTVATFTTINTQDWNLFSETEPLPLGELLPGTFQVTITLMSTDGHGVDLDTLALTWSPRNWHNHRLAYDVNDDTYTTPNDVLIIITELNANDTRQLPVPPPSDTAIPYYDVNGDGYISPLDALLVVNVLNQTPVATAEGEAVEMAMVIATESAGLPVMFDRQTASAGVPTSALVSASEPTADGVDEIMADIASPAWTSPDDRDESIFYDRDELTAIEELEFPPLADGISLP